MNEEKALTRTEAMSIIALRHYQVAPDYRISVVAVRDKKHRISKFRVHRRKVKKKFRTILSQFALPRSIKLRHKFR
jgi:hypothetical protein